MLACKHLLIDTKQSRWGWWGQSEISHALKMMNAWTELHNFKCVEFWVCNYNLLLFWRCDPRWPERKTIIIPELFVRGTRQHQSSSAVQFNHSQSITSAIAFNLAFLSPTLFCSWILAIDSPRSDHLLSGLQQTQRLMFCSGGFRSSLGAGRLLVKESIWLDSLTNCIKRQSCPWSAPQLIDGSTHLHRKSSRQNGGESVAFVCSPTSCAIYLPPLSSLALPLFTHTHTTPHDSNLFKTKSNFSQPLRFAQNVHLQHTNALIRHFICKFAVRIEWQWVCVERLLRN